MRTMNVELHKELGGGDYFSTTISEDGKSVYRKNYTYGDNGIPGGNPRVGQYLSEGRISSVLQKLIDNYEVGDFSVTGGHDYSSREGGPVRRMFVDKFKEQYCENLETYVRPEDRKYEMALETEFKGQTVYRIRALRDFGDIKAGDLGGYVATNKSLSQAGESWVYPDAYVLGNGRVKENATISSGTVVEENAVVSGSASISGDVLVTDDARVSGQAEVTSGIAPNKTVIEDDTLVSGNAQVIGEVTVSGAAKVLDNAMVMGTAPLKSNIRLDAVVDENGTVINSVVTYGAHVHGDAVVSGDPETGEPAKISGRADIKDQAQIVAGANIEGHTVVSGSTKIYAPISEGITGYSRNLEGDRQYNSVSRGTEYKERAEQVIKAARSRFDNGLEDDFADAVAAIPADDKGLEQ